jgi:hypothetical protein
LSDIGDEGGDMDGVVEKVMRKNVQVKVMNEDGLIRGIYNCTPTLLTHRSK